MDVKFLVDDFIIPGFVKPISKTSIKEDCSTYSLELFFEAPPQITTKIDLFLKTLAPYPNAFKDWTHDSDVGIIHSWRQYTGTQIYVSKFYQTLGIALPSLMEEKEPSILEIMHLAGPATTAASSIDEEAVLTLFKNYQKADAALNDLENQLFQKEATTLLLQIKEPGKDLVLFSTILEQKRLLKAAIAEQKMVWIKAFSALSDYLPSIKIKERDSD